MQRWLDPVQIPGQGERPGFLNGQPGMGFRLKFDGIGPIQQGRHLAAHEQKTTIFLDQLCSPVLVACRDGLLDGFGDKSVLLVPLGSAAMQLGEQMGILVFQALPENIRKEMVITIPMPLIIQRDDKEIHLFQGFQHRLPIDRLGCIRVDDGLAQRSAQAIQDRGLQQEGAHLLGLKS